MLKRESIKFTISAPSRDLMPLIHAIKTQCLQKVDSLQNQCLSRLK